MMYSRRRIPAITPLPLAQKVEELGILGTDMVALGGYHRSAPNFFDFHFLGFEVPFLTLIECVPLSLTIF